MEPEAVGPKKRGRKRKIKDVHTVTVEPDRKKKTVGYRSMQLIGRYVQKEFGSALFLGKVSSYDSGLYRINYEDGDFEDLDSREVKTFLIEDNALIGEWSKKKVKLDKILISKESKANNSKSFKIKKAVKQETMELVKSELSNGDTGANEVARGCDDGKDHTNVDIDADSISDASEYAEELDACPDTEVPLVPPPELPPSSGHIGVPEEYVSHLLSVHSFLRSFSVPLFLYPFGLDDFVGALNCSLPNSLLDSIHVALMCVLKRHFEKLSEDGSEIAVKCLSFLDWSLLDTLTWPVYLAHYLMVMGYTNEADWKGFYTHLLHEDYYTLSAGKKLVVLQILCDDVLDSEELRAEMDMRVESEVGIDIDSSSMVAPTREPRRVHPRNSKTSACKDREEIHGMASRHETKPSTGNHMTGSDVGASVGSLVDEDANGDECRLCGMDGLLLCCDGCPSSYHSRCLGLSKMHVSSGSWYCPECKLNATEPKILQGTTLCGGRNLGVDPYDQVFIVNGDNLLILKASATPESTFRYYKRHDIPRVIHALCVKTEHVVVYSEILREILKYWELPESLLPSNGTAEVGAHLANNAGSGESTAPLPNLLTESVPLKTEVDSNGSCVTSIIAADIMSCTEQTLMSENSSDTIRKSGRLDNTDSSKKHPSDTVNTRMTGPTLNSGLVGQSTNLSDLTRKIASSLRDTVSQSTKNSNVNYSLHVNGTKLSFSCVESNGGVDGNPQSACSYMGSSFKTNGYTNHYLHGDFAASAAAKLAILSSEENQALKSRPSDNPRKVLSANISLQVKAFSSAAPRFVWPNTDRKLVEVPRERCSWCFSCKASVASRKGCLLNAAASNATKAAMKVFAGIRPMKNEDVRLPGISTYIVFMEESLRGLLVGPFLNASFRNRWRRQVEQTATCNALKILLLELEENTRTIAFSGDWTKVVGGGSTQSSASQIATSTAGSTQKRKPGRRGRKPSAVVEVTMDDAQDMSTDFTWWRGKELSKLVSDKGDLPCSIARKAARHGSSKKILGIHYTEGDVIPKISRQLIWRSAVEISRNVAQLALQVRYLDFYVRWSDFVRPEQMPSDGKGPETEASAFRNASICDKKTLGHEIRYCIAFGNQKHLPSRVMKSVAEVEQTGDDGPERYWFCETRLPLYLVKEYEEKVKKDQCADVLSKLQRRLKKRQLKASRKNIFLYLSRKKDNTGKVYCCSCQRDVLFRDSATCSSCQGFCHTQCATSSTFHTNGEVEFLMTCKKCSESLAKTQVEYSTPSPATPSIVRGQDLSLSAVAASKNVKKSLKGSSAFTKTKYRSSVKVINVSESLKKSKNKQWGLIFRKDNSVGDTGIDFRTRYILLKGNPDSLLQPSCRLCSQPYNSGLMYIHCDTCKSWYHADSVELDESRIFSLVGFKCCLCRRIRSPVCPYLDPYKKKLLEDKIERQLSQRTEVSETQTDSGLISDEYYDEGASEVTRVESNDPLHISLSEFDEYAKEGKNTQVVDYGLNDNVQGPRKLPVRRHSKQENPCDSFQVETSTEKLPIRRHTRSTDYHSTIQIEYPNQVNAPGDSISPQIQWDVSNDGNMIMDYDNCVGLDDMEFEPQTYFSFDELLTVDEKPLGDVTKEWEDESMEFSFETADFDIVACNICTNTEPHPDLSCLLCGLWIHKGCSPWIESPEEEDSWKCGNCRNWR